MQSRQQGFTLIELVVVIVILGILAATALPKFIDMSTDASTAATAGIAGGISSAAAVNYAGRQMSTPKGVAYLSTTPCAKAALDTIMQTPLDSNYTYADSGTAVDCSTAANGTAATCSVTPKTGGGTAATATVICTK